MTTIRDTQTMLVTGGTGRLGSLVVPKLRASGHDVRVLSRSVEGAGTFRADLRKGTGDLDAALRGVSTLVHLAGGQKGDDVATANLMEAARRAGVSHVVFVSVIGAEQVPIGWFRMKRAAEEAVVASGIPFTILRAAQFHDLLVGVARGMSRLPVVPIPGGLRFEPVDHREVAADVVSLALGSPQGRVPDLAGPEILPMRDLMGAYLSASGKHRMTMPMRMPGAAGRAYRDGANLAGTGSERGVETWAEYLAEIV